MRLSHPALGQLDGLVVLRAPFAIIERGTVVLVQLRLELIRILNLDEGVNRQRDLDDEDRQ